MHRFIRSLALALAGCALQPLSAAAETIGGNPGPQYNYICPHADGAGALDCYFDAVQHLYTMCRNVKSIEIIEFGFEDSIEGINAAKFESCLDKQKLNMAKPYQAALKEAHISKQAVEGVQSLQEHWLASMQGIRWKRGETDYDYKTRLEHVYDEFREKIAGIRTIVAVVKEKTSPVAGAHAAPAQKPAKKSGKPAKPAESASGTKDKTS
jgi:hypothetical protein